MRANSSKDLLAELICEAFELCSRAILYWMRNDNGGTIESDSTALDFESICKFLGDDVYPRNAAAV